MKRRDVLLILLLSLLNSYAQSPDNTFITLDSANVLTPKKIVLAAVGDAMPGSAIPSAEAMLSHDKPW